MIINVVGALSLVTSARSWGLVMTNIALALQALGHDVRCVPTNGQVAIDPRLRPYLVDKPDPEAPVFTYTIPPELAKMPGRVYAMTAYESSILPLGWADMLNQKRVQVIVNSTQQQGMMKANGVKAVVVPLGIDPDVYKPEGPKLNLGSKYKFLSIGIPHYRKGFDLLLKAFAEEFKPDEDVALVIKTDKLKKLNYWEIDIEAEIKKVQYRRKTAEIMLVTGDVVDLAPLYRACQCYVSSTRGEGFGLTILEAMACGLQILATDKGGHMDFCNEWHIDSCKGKAPTAVQYHTYNPTATMNYPNINCLKIKIRTIFDGNKLKSNFDPSAWTWEASARKLLAVMGVKDGDTQFNEWVEKQNAV